MTAESMRTVSTAGAGASPLAPAGQEFPKDDFSYELPFFSTDDFSSDSEENESDVASVDSFIDTVMRLEDADEAVDFVLYEGPERGASDYVSVDSRRATLVLDAFAVLAERVRMMNKRSFREADFQTSRKSAAAKRRRRVGGRFEKEVGFVCVPR